MTARSVTMPGAEMPMTIRYPGPMRAFAMIFLPAALTAGMLVAALSSLAPALSGVLAMLMLLAGFVLAVRGAATGHLGPGQATVRHILAMREARLRNACRFAAIGTGAALAVGAGAAAIGAPLLPGAGAGAAALLFALLFVVAWLVIGEAACTGRAIRRALLGERELR